LSDFRYCPTSSTMTLVLDERSGKIQDIDAEDDGVRDGAGVAGRKRGGVILHRVVEWETRDCGRMMD
jgi:hypothetical protein